MATLAQLKEDLATTEAQIRVVMAEADSISADGRSVKNHTLQQLREHVAWLEGKIAAKQRRGRSRLIYVEPRV